MSVWNTPPHPELVPEPTPTQLMYEMVDSLRRGQFVDLQVWAADVPSEAVGKRLAATCLDLSFLTDELKRELMKEKAAREA